MTEYKIISDYSTNQIEFTISYLLQQGWQLAGGINVIVHNNNPDYPKADEQDTLLFIQALVR